ncbi:hypothetical protein DXG01_002374 [Tephrocybe rancida]|nr:hypothetical protein DXG01_002374 [Tephrocybe rancida]
MRQIVPSASTSAILQPRAPRPSKNCKNKMQSQEVRKRQHDTTPKPSGNHGPDANLKLICQCSGNPTPILDHSSHIIGVAAGQDSEATWLGGLAKLTDRLEKARQECHSRGTHPFLSSSFSHGGGRTEPMNLNPPGNPNFHLVEELVGNPAMKRLMGQLSSIFSTWAPKLYDFYNRNINKFCLHSPELKRNWLGSVFAAVMFNLSPQTVCYPHKDFANLPFGWCSITTLGNFDPT